MYEYKYFSSWQWINRIEESLAMMKNIYTRTCLALSTHTPTPPLAMDETPNRDLREGPEAPKCVKRQLKGLFGMLWGPPEPLFGENLRSSYAQLALGEAESFIPVR